MFRFILNTLSSIAILVIIYDYFNPREGKMIRDSYCEFTKYISVLCGICHKRIDQRLFTTACRHTFHRGCLLKWLYETNLNCPVCETKLM